LQGGGDGGVIKPGLADHNQLGLARGIAEGLVEIGVNAGANGLQGQAHGFARDRNEAFQAQDAMGADDVGDLVGKGIGVGDFATGDDEAFKLIMAMFVFMVVVVMIVVIIVVMVMMVDLVTGGEIALRADTLA